jgi:hypothetical protein
VTEEAVDHLIIALHRFERRLFWRFGALWAVAMAALFTALHLWPPHG